MLVFPVERVIQNEPAGDIDPGPNVRLPVVSHEWEDGTHLGVDVMFTRMPWDPKAGHPKFVVPAGTRSRAIADGAIVYAKPAANGWRVRLDHGACGVHSIYLHHTKLLLPSLVPGTRVLAGSVLGIIGADPTDPEGLVHLHFEIRRIASGGDAWGCKPVDPAQQLGWPWAVI